MCAECGADLRTDEVTSRDVAVVPMVHSVPELKVTTMKLILVVYLAQIAFVFQYYKHKNT